jgi:sulfide:quinone oxidoreductase
LTVAEPFGLGSAARYSLPEIAAEFGAGFVHATVTAVAAAEHRVSCAGGPDLGFDTLILAPGARMRPPFADAITFGVAGSGRAVKDMLSRLRSGEVRSAAFVAPSMAGWLLPLYELALMTARELERSKVEGAQVRLVTPEDRPLTLFGDRGSESVARQLAGDRVHRRDARDGPRRRGGAGHNRGVGGRRLRRYAAAHARAGAGRCAGHAA